MPAYHHIINPLSKYLSPLYCLVLPVPPLSSPLSPQVPIVEPEILLDGDHDIDRTLEVAEATWAETFKYMADNNVLLEGILLKPSMVTPGAEHAKRPTPEEVREELRGGGEMRGGCAPPWGCPPGAAAAVAVCWGQL